MLQQAGHRVDCDTIMYSEVLLKCNGKSEGNATAIGALLSNYKGAFRWCFVVYWHFRHYGPCYILGGVLFVHWPFILK